MRSWQGHSQRRLRRSLSNQSRSPELVSTCGASQGTKTQLQAFRDGLRDLGYVEGEKRSTRGSLGGRQARTAAGSGRRAGSVDGGCNCRGDFAIGHRGPPSDANDSYCDAHQFRSGRGPVGRKSCTPGRQYHRPVGHVSRTGRFPRSSYLQSTAVYEGLRQGAGLETRKN